MQLRYDDDFVEGAVFLCASATRRAAPAPPDPLRNHMQIPVPGGTKICTPPPFQIARFHREREKLYSILDPDDRNAAFFHLHLEWFREWGLEKLLLGLTDEFPRLRAELSTLVFRKARVKSDEGAELYVSAENGRAGVVALRVERFAQPEELARFLRHELTHLDDMLNPLFGYSPDLARPGRNAAQLRLTRERYRLLWDITIDGRQAAVAAARTLTTGEPRLNTPPPHVGGYDRCGRDGHRANFDRAFDFWPETKRDEVFASLWNNPDPRHADLLAIAADPRGLESASRAMPGSPCPLCGFATFDWADVASLDAPTIAAVQREFPQWTTDQRACGRCIEIYRQVGVASVPAL